MFETKEWNANKDPVILITQPKVVEDQFDYSESHIIYKGNDLGSFEELKVMKEENERSNEYIDFYKELNEKAVKSVKYYVDILTDLKKWLEDTKTKSQYLASNYYYDSCVLEKIKELEDKYNA